MTAGHRSNTLLSFAGSVGHCFHLVLHPYMSCMWRLNGVSSEIRCLILLQTARKWSRKLIFV